MLLPGARANGVETGFDDIAGLPCETAVEALDQREEIASARITRMDMGSGVVTAVLELPRKLFYETVSQRCGLEIHDDGDLIGQLVQMASMKRKYEKVEQALILVEETGYGIVMPDEPASAQWQAGIQLEKREQA